MTSRLLFFFALFAAGTASAQRINDPFGMAWKAKGVVLDSATQKPIAGVRVNIYMTAMLELTILMDDSLVYTCITDSAGKFTMPGMEIPGGTGSCRLRFVAQKTGYMPPADLWKTKYDYRNTSVTATVWMKRSKGVRLVPKDD